VLGEDVFRTITEPEPPVTKAEVLSVDIGDPMSQATIRYTGSSGAVTIRSNWQDEGGRPVIVRAEPAD
jgi:hypothetical protein